MYPEPLTRTTSRLSRRSSGDLRAIRRATARIEELTAALDRQLSAEPREEERLRLLRLTTGQITRTANDGIQAYRRVTEGLRAESDRTDADPDEAERMAAALAEARTEMLGALDVASRRYPWAKPWRGSPEDDEGSEDDERPGGVPPGRIGLTL